MQAGAGIGPILYVTWLLKDKNKTWAIPLLGCVPLVFLRFRRIETQKITERLQEENLFDYHKKSRLLKNHLHIISRILDQEKR